MAGVSDPKRWQRGCDFGGYTNYSNLSPTDLEAQFQQFPASQTISNSRNYISLPCQAPESNPPATINWYKDDVLIQVSSRFMEQQNGSL